MTTNPHTGDKLQTKPGNRNFVDGFAAAFNSEYAISYLDENGNSKELTVFAESYPQARIRANDQLKKMPGGNIQNVRKVT